MLSAALMTIKMNRHVNRQLSSGSMDPLSALLTSAGSRIHLDNACVFPINLPSKLTAVVPLCVNV